MTTSPGVFRRLDRVRDQVTGALLIAVFVLVNLQVFFRYVLNDPLSWPEEVARVCFLWLAYLGIAKLFRERLHYAIGFFIALAPPRAQTIAALCVDLCSLAAFAAILIGAWPVLESNSHIRTAIGLPVNLLYASLPTATLLVIPAILLSLNDHFRNIVGSRRSMPTRSSHSGKTL
jgi:TRAP-type C4-dicarboxylate transport system permease small subunit